MEKREFIDFDTAFKLIIAGSSLVAPASDGKDKVDDKTGQKGIRMLREWLVVPGDIGPTHSSPLAEKSDGSNPIGSEAVAGSIRDTRLEDSVSEIGSDNRTQKKMIPREAEGPKSQTRRTR